MSKRPAKKKTGLHGPSFFGGLLVGALIASAIFAPRFLSEQFAKLPEVVPGQDDLDVVFEFPDLLRQSEVPIDPGSYGNPSGSPPAPGMFEPNDAATPQATDRPPVTVEESAAQRTARIYLQAGSFRDRQEADKLRANLLLQGLPANLEQVVLDSGTWHRVKVGPFEQPEAADKINRVLREQKIFATRYN